MHYKQNLWNVTKSSEIPVVVVLERNLSISSGAVARGPVGCGGNKKGAVTSSSRKDFESVGETMSNLLHASHAGQVISHSFCARPQVNPNRFATKKETERDKAAYPGSRCPGQNARRSPNCATLHNGVAHQRRTLTKTLVVCLETARVFGCGSIEHVSDCGSPKCFARNRRPEPYHQNPPKVRSRTRCDSSVSVYAPLSNLAIVGLHLFEFVTLARGHLFGFTAPRIPPQPDKGTK